LSPGHLRRRGDDRGADLVLTAAEEAGPGITVSFVIAGVVSTLAALCYAELAAMVPVAGSAYTFSYASLGKLVAFVIGWDLVLELTIGASTVAVGFGGYRAPNRLRGPGRGR
jgi:basic amino acid/polyamine antiporter, APA family